MTERIKRFWIREPFCGFSHGIGAALSVAALVALLILAHGKVWQTVTFAVFGVSLIVLYTASTLYHSLWVKPKQIMSLMRFDHVAIFLLIAGTYAPVCLVGLRGAWGWSLFGVEYGLAVIGIVCSLSLEELPGLGADRHLRGHGLADYDRHRACRACAGTGGHRLAVRRRRGLLYRHGGFCHRPPAPVARQVQRP